MTRLVLRKVIKLEEPQLERVQVICPACGQQVEVVDRDGHIKGYCAVAKQYVDFPIEIQRAPTGKSLSAETKAKLSAAIKKIWQDPEYRARHTAHMKKRWQAPEYRAKQIATHIGKHHTAKTKAKISAALKGRHTPPRC